MWLFFFQLPKSPLLSQLEPTHTSFPGPLPTKPVQVYVKEHWLRCLSPRKKTTKSILSALNTIRNKCPKICANQSAFGSTVKAWQCLDPGEEQSRLMKPRKHLLENARRSGWISICVRMSKQRKPVRKRKRQFSELCLMSSKTRKKEEASASERVKTKQC